MAKRKPQAPTAPAGATVTMTPNPVTLGTNASNPVSIEAAGLSPNHDYVVFVGQAPQLWTHSDSSGALHEVWPPAGSKSSFWVAETAAVQVIDSTGPDDIVVAESPYTVA